MGWILLGANALLAVALLLFVREARREWGTQAIARQIAQQRYDDHEQRLSNDEIRLANYFRQLRAMQEQMGWKDDHAWTRAIPAHERFGGPPPLPSRETNESE